MYFISSNNIKDFKFHYPLKDTMLRVGEGRKIRVFKRQSSYSELDSKREGFEPRKNGISYVIIAETLFDFDKFSFYFMAKNDKKRHYLKDVLSFII